MTNTEQLSPLEMPHYAGSRTENSSRVLLCCDATTHSAAGVSRNYCTARHFREITPSSSVAGSGVREQFSNALLGADNLNAYDVQV